ncbi:MerC domain-containing protein [Winogradskyella helgolandensis]|uniref:MerC domain-containing protein n=1 Tax=Winogradskyella helgolandensis TaxID=2697010 RepID=UPI0015BF8E32|nr:MerC domain-containing protein [Winogradskyella helgolandensis]
MNSTKNNTLDLIALTSSLICAIHCAIFPILLSFSSLSSLYFLNNPIIEWAFISLGIVFLFTSLWPSYKNNHHNTKPLKMALFGFAFIALGRLHLTHLWEVFNTVIGATLLAVAHYSNWKLLRSTLKENH